MAEGLGRRPGLAREDERGGIAACTELGVVPPLSRSESEEGVWDLKALAEVERVELGARRTVTGKGWVMEVQEKRGKEEKDNNT